jgi:hypothetical protein
VALAACLLPGAGAVAKDEYSEAEAQKLCAGYIPQQPTEAIFARSEVHRETMGGLGFVCKVFLEGATPDLNIGLSIWVSSMSHSVRKYKDGKRMATGPTIKVDGVGDDAVAIVEYQGDRVRGLAIEGIKGSVYFSLWTEPREMTDALYQQCAAFMRMFVANLRPD